LVKPAILMVTFCSIVIFTAKFWGQTCQVWSY
jgi:hypothetical protein